MIERDNQPILFQIFSNDDEMFVVGIRRNTDSAPLADGVEMKSSVISDFSTVGGENFSRRICDEMSKKIIHPDISDEADSLTVFFVRIWEIVFGGDFSNFRLCQISDRKFSPGELILSKHCEKISLAFLGIDSFEKVETSIFTLDFPDIMTGCNAAETFLQCIIEQNSE